MELELCDFVVFLSRHYSSIFDDHCGQALGILYVDCLHIAVQLLLGTLLIITLPRYPHPQPERHTLDTGFPYFFVELRIETNILGSLERTQVLLPSLWKY